MISLVTLKIFVSSPGDVGEERYVAARVIDRLRAEWAGRVNLEAEFWENEALAETKTQISSRLDSAITNIRTVLEA